MNVPKRFRDARLEDWEKGSPIRDLMEDYLGNFHEYYQQGKAPFLVGKAGTGKTRCAAALMNYIQNGATETLDVHWYSASEVFNQLLDAKDLYMKDLYVDLKTNLRSSDVLILDDISTLRSYNRLTEAFWTVLDYRYSEMKSTILTGNFDVTETSGDFWGYLEETLSPAISRRIKECAEGLTLIF